SPLSSACRISSKNPSTMSFASRLFNPRRSNKASASSAFVIVFAVRSPECIAPAVRGRSGNLKSAVGIESRAGNLASSVTDVGVLQIFASAPQPLLQLPRQRLHRSRNAQYLVEPIGTQDFSRYLTTR